MAASSDLTASDSDTTSGPTLQLEQAALVLDPELAVRPEPVRRDHAVAGNDERNAVLGAEGPRRPLGAGTPRQRSELAVRDDLTATDRAKRADQVAVERRVFLEVDLDVVQVDGLAPEEGLETLDDRMIGRSSGLVTGTRKLVPDDHVAVEPHLADTPSGRRIAKGLDSHPRRESTIGP